MQLSPDLHPLFLLQVISPYPLSVLKTSATTTSATYKLQLLPDYHSPPEPPFTNLTVSFLSPLADQEEIVAVTFSMDGACEATPTLSITSDAKKSALANKGVAPLLTFSQSSQLVLIVGSIFLFVLIVLVLCVALQKTSTSNSGFRVHLPPSGGQPPHHFISPTPSPVTSPSQQPLYSQGRGPPGGFPSTSTPNVTTPAARLNTVGYQPTPFPGSGITPTTYQRRSSSSPKQPSLFSQ